jgi:hypothetical protein
MTGLPPSSVILTDTTAAAGWLHHSSLDDSWHDSPPLCPWIASATAQFLLDHSSILFSKWFPGKENQVANSLSQDHHITNELLPLVHSSFPEQMPWDFAICPLPRKLSSQIMMWLHWLLSSSQSPKVPTQSKIGTSATTPHSSSGLSSRTMARSSTPSTHSAAPASSAPSPTHMDSEDSPQLRTLIRERQDLFATPSTLWLRPIGLTGIAAPATTLAGNSPSFYQMN